MKTCSCGNVAEENSVNCARCNALQALELKPDASTVEIESAFDVLSRAWNPQRFQNDSAMKAMAEEKLTAIENAHSFLARSSVQAAPYRSEAAGERTEAPIDTVPEKKALGQVRKTRKQGYSDGAERPLRLPVPILIGCGVIVSGALVAWVLFKPLDSALMAIPVAGKIYASYKTSVRSSIQELKNKVGIGTGPSGPTVNPDATAASPAPNQTAQDTGETAPATHRTTRLQAGSSHTVVRVQPYITAGLSKSEIIAIQGTPTSETSNELDYGSSKLYFSNDALAGWKIDLASPLRVKLWPDAAVDPALAFFGVGSTKNEVLVVQGTPTFFSESTFGYGSSEVYFKNGRVVSWKSDAATPLRTASR
jgi:hypothetical protein